MAYSYQFELTAVFCLIKVYVDYISVIVWLLPMNILFLYRPSDLVIAKAKPFLPCSTLLNISPLSPFSYHQSKYLLRDCLTMYNSLSLTLSLSSLLYNVVCICLNMYICVQVINNLTGCVTQHRIIASGNCMLCIVMSPSNLLAISYLNYNTTRESVYYYCMNIPSYVQNSRKFNCSISNITAKIKQLLQYNIIIAISSNY